MNTQQRLVESVKRRGFYDTLPSVASNIVQMEAFLQGIVDKGQDARRIQRIPDSFYYRVSSSSKLVGNALLMAEMLRRVEELGELAKALLKGDIEQARVECSDGFVVDCQIANILDMDLEQTALDKAQADEQRGRLHGETIYPNGKEG